MANEVKLVLQADTKSAQQSIKKFEDDIKGLNKIKGKVGSEGIISKRDLEDFRRTQKQFSQDYQNYLRSQIDSIRKLRDEQKRLLDSIESATNKKTKQQFDTQLQSVNRQKAMAEEGLRTARGFAQSRNAASEVVNQSKQVPNWLAGGKLAGQGLIAYMGAKQVYGKLNQGYNMYYDKLSTAGQLAQKNGQYGSNYGQLMTEAGNTGFTMGFGGAETLQTMSNYTKVAGVRDWYKAQEDVATFQKFGRAYGISPDSIAGLGGTASSIGITKEGDQRKFANLLAYSIKNQGMQGREEEFVEATKNLSSAVSSNMTGLDQNQFANVLGLENFLSKSGTSMKGEKLASVTESLNSDITGGNHLVDLALGWGTELRGPEGMLELKRRKAQGLTGNNLQKIAQSIQNLPGNDAIKENVLWDTLSSLGANPQLGDYMFQNLGDIASGKLNITPEKLAEMQKTGGADVDNKASDYTNSDLLTKNQYDATTEQALTLLGEISAKLVQPFQVIMAGAGAGVGAATQIGTTIAGGVAQGYIANKVATSIFGGAATEGGEAAGGIARFLPALGGLAKSGAGRFLGPAVAVGVGAIDVATSDNKAKAVSRNAGGLAGMLAGAKLGAMGGGAVGAMFAGVGAVPGAAIGGFLGGAAGYFGGSKIGDSLYDYFTKPVAKPTYDTSNYTGFGPKQLAYTGTNPSIVSGYFGAGAQQSTHNVNIHISGDVTGFTDLQKNQITSQLVTTFNSTNLINLLSSNNQRKVPQ